MSRLQPAQRGASNAVDTPLLDSITGPEALKRLPEEQLPLLCGEIRRFLIASVLRTGGHLASNLGTVELTVALHRVLHSPQDKLVFDVGHQCYTHKLLTGRKAGFAHLRQKDGISGFPNPRESEHDAFVAGHGNTALSLAIGMAWAKKLRHEPGWVVAIIGDGAFTGGMIYEGMNNIAALDNLMVVLNDNGMSISKNVGAMARYLTHLRASPGYFRVNRHLSGALSRVPLVGQPAQRFFSRAKALVRRAMYDSTMFENMGFQYMGPLDGHKVLELEQTLRNLTARGGPLFLHVVTTKGKGYPPAEQNPGEFHGVSAGSQGYVPDPEVAAPASFSTVFGKALCAAAAADGKICAITAAMKYGTGLQFFGHAYRARFFDVGMAEQHAGTFAAGLASPGARRRRDPPGRLRPGLPQRGGRAHLFALQLRRAALLAGAAAGPRLQRPPGHTLPPRRRGRGPGAVRLHRPRLRLFDRRAKGARRPGQLRQRGGGRAGGRPPAAGGGRGKQGLQACKDISLYRRIPARHQGI